jgi:hypothetical protein
VTLAKLMLPFSELWQNQKASFGDHPTASVVRE